MTWQDAVAASPTSIAQRWEGTRRWLRYADGAVLVKRTDGIHEWQFSADKGSSLTDWEPA